ncbi:MULTISPECIES: nickel ABC transporter permease [Thermus]|jgi:peptide/nickel transport system permease protein/oligopeptide transport system permease protein|uniref:Peptide ABC transporter, permease protein n=2 Tax=Thermus thermophilus TaxID=274 RepID=Q5SIN2_THET8|nr:MULTISPECIES: nickel ABC transporter permease [Thermus]QZY57929.1 ABC transporter permease [Thermus thermophilus]BAD71160.1 peptide ABC transporter, permease protein [Thermus thermophilus HB8]BBL93863.1 peptide ABC transporter permease [Thermus thermophilus]BCP66490.1 peptide ABC transporter permease [Thermus thermophilus]BCP98445.1 peptide ABC transporter permease [Thermus thermophilus]
MLTYLLRRILIAVPTLLGVVLLVFLMVRLAPGDPAILLAGEFATPETLEAIRTRYGLDRPLPEQFALYLGALLQGDLGESARSRRPVLEELKTYFPNTVVLATAAILVALATGIPLGILAALRQGSWLDLGVMVLALLGVSMPVFWFGLLAILIFSVELGWFPVAGKGTLAHLVLPAVTLGINATALLARMTRGTLVEVLSQDYIRTARAKGLAERVVIFKHALRNALIPVVTVAGLEFGSLLAGAVITETIFAWPGLGQLLVGSILSRDYPVVQGAVLLVAFTFTLVNLMVDLLYAWIDPRVRYD